MARHPITQRKANRKFKNRTKRTHVKNIINPLRGGIRL